MTAILYTVATLAVLGFLFGGVLALVNKKFAVPENPVKDAVLKVLPEANCGACGFPGCEAYAEAIALGGVSLGLCPVGGDEVAARISEILGVEVEPPEKMVAIVMCRGDEERCGIRFDYDGPRDCRSASLVAQGDKECSFSCLGLGDCERACPFGAIAIRKGRLAEVDKEKCVGCGLCTAECPRGILALYLKSEPVRRTCSAMARGKIVTSHCKAGCVGCGKCERSCKFSAIKLVNDLPEIDYRQCVGCMSCADDCPTGALLANEALRRLAFINPKKCNRCGICEKICPFGAVTHNEDGRYIIAAWNCTGCGVCLKECKCDAIEIAAGFRHKR